MTTTLVTGATGLVGYNVTKALLAHGRAVRALVRNPDRARAVLAGVELAEGDITDEASIRRAMTGCPVVYHAAGLPEQWLPRVDMFDEVNAGGTETVCKLALELQVSRLVYTSTIDVFAAGIGEEYDESVIDPKPKHTHYERSKQRADRAVVEAMSQGLEAVFLHPAAVYGPGPAASPGINALIADLRDGKVPALLPGGMPLVFAEDVGYCHVAAESQPSGSRFILAERYYSLVELAEIVCAAVGSKRPRVLPRWLARFVSFCGEGLARVTKRPPLIPRGQFTFLQWQARPTSAHAQRTLDWTPVPFAGEGLRRTLEFLSGDAGSGSEP